MTAIAADTYTAFEAVAEEASKARGLLARFASRVTAVFRAARIRVRASASTPRP